jgi:hypothetical protein
MFDIERFQTGPPRVVYHDLSRFIPADQMDSVEEWQVRKFVKQRAAHMQQLTSILNEKFEEFQADAESASAKHHKLPLDECIPDSDVRAPVDDKQLQQRLLRTAQAASRPVGLPVASIPKIPEHSK